MRREATLPFGARMRPLVLALPLAALAGSCLFVPAAPAQEASGQAVPAPLIDGREGRVPHSSFSPDNAAKPGSLGGNTATPPAGAAAKDDGVSQEEKAYGAFQRGYYLTAMNLALPAAQKGSPSAQTLIAEIFAHGLGVAKSMDDAAFWYGQAAKNGDPSAQFRYALLLMQGKYVKKDEAQAQALMKKAADAGVAAAQFNHAQWLVSKQPGEKGLMAALPYYEKAAKAGIPDAQYALSQIYRNSADIPKEKRGKARYWLTQAAMAGYDTAELDLGIWLIDGIEGPTDYAKGFEWMQRAARNGNVMAENRLAHLYRAGIGTKQDRVAAATWYILARRAGLQDNELEDFFQGLTDDEQKQALKQANDIQAQ